MRTPRNRTPAGCSRVGRICSRTPGSCLSTSAPCNRIFGNCLSTGAGRDRTRDACYCTVRVVTAPATVGIERVRVVSLAGNVCDRLTTRCNRPVASSHRTRTRSTPACANPLLVATVFDSSPACCHRRRRQDDWTVANATAAGEALVRYTITRQLPVASGVKCSVQLTNSSNVSDASSASVEPLFLRSVNPHAEAHLRTSSIIASAASCRKSLVGCSAS